MPVKLAHEFMQRLDADTTAHGHRATVRTGRLGLAG